MEPFTNPATTDAAAPARSLNAPLTDRVNVEPPILRGMTQSEAAAIGLAAQAVWLVERDVVEDIASPVQATATDSALTARGPSGRHCWTASRRDDEQPLQR